MLQISRIVAVMLLTFLPSIPTPQWTCSVYICWPIEIWVVNLAVIDSYLTLCAQALHTCEYQPYMAELKSAIWTDDGKIVTGSKLPSSMDNRGVKKTKAGIWIGSGCFPILIYLHNHHVTFFVLGDWFVLALEYHFEPKYSKDFQNMSAFIFDFYSLNIFVRQIGLGGYNPEVHTLL